MAISQLESPLFKSVLNADGAPNDSGKVYVYEVGGNYLTNAVTTWTDKTKAVENTNPIVLSASGEAQIWFDGTVDIKVDDSADTQQYTLSGVESSPTATVTGNYNLVQNGSFEIDTAGDGAPDSWTLVPGASSTILIDATSGGQAQGSQGLKFTSGGTSGGVATSELFNVTDGGTLDTTFKFKVEDATIDESTNTVVLYWYDYAGDAHSGTPSTSVWSVTTAAPTSWTTYEYRTAVPSGATHAKIVISGIVAGGTEVTNAKSVWFDGVSVAEHVQSLEVATVQTPTSGTTIDFENIPAGTKRITMLIDEVSTTASNTILFFIGDSDGIDTTADYSQGQTTEKSAAADLTQVTDFSGALVGYTGAAADTITGVIELINITGHVWIIKSHAFTSGNNDWLVSLVCRKALDKTLDRVQIALNGGGTFDAGTINIIYED